MGSALWLSKHEHEISSAKNCILMTHKRSLRHNTLFSRALASSPALQSAWGVSTNQNRMRKFRTRSNPRSAGYMIRGRIAPCCARGLHSHNVTHSTVLGLVEALQIHTAPQSAIQHVACALRSHPNMHLVGSQVVSNGTKKDTDVWNVQVNQLSRCASTIPPDSRSVSYLPSTRLAILTNCT